MMGPPGTGKTMLAKVCQAMAEVMILTVLIYFSLLVFFFIFFFSSHPSHLLFFSLTEWLVHIK